MSKFINSKEAITSPLLLWQEKPTQISVKKTYDMKVWPISNLYNDSPLNFKIPPQPHGMLTSIDVVTKFCIYNDGHPITVEMHKHFSCFALCLHDHLNGFQPFPTFHHQCC